MTRETRLDLEQLIKKSIADFEALTPDQQRAQRLAQRRSWIIGETMLENPEMTRERAEQLADQCLKDAGLT